MSSIESTSQPGMNKARAKPSMFADSSLAHFAMPASSSSSDIEAMVRRNPLAALLAAVCVGIVIGKLLR
jgi:hypothetical protein